MKQSELRHESTGKIVKNRLAHTIALMLLISANLTGKWTMHMGPTLEHLALQDHDGVLDGTVDKDPQWGGDFHVAGHRTGPRVQLHGVNKYGVASYDYDGQIESSVEIVGDVDVKTQTFAGVNDKEPWTARKIEPHDDRDLETPSAKPTPAR